MAVPDITDASSFVHEYEFSWTINDLSLSPDVLRGPSVPQIPGLPYSLVIELQFKQYKESSCSHFSLNIALTDLSVKGNNFAVSSCTSLRRANDATIKSTEKSIPEFKGSIQLLDYTYSRHSNESPFPTKLDLIRNLNLVDDKLIVKGKLSFSILGFIEKITSLIVKNGSEAYGELLKNLATTYESGHSSDITFLIEEEELTAHKIILRSHSPVFAKMFDNDLSKSNSNEIVIEDTDFHAFNCFLIFLYSGEVEDDDNDTVLSLYYLAHKYQVNSLHSTCSSLLGDNLETESVCRVLELSDLHGDEELKRVAKVFIRHHIIKIAGTTEWVNLVTTKPHLVKEVLA